MLPEDGDLCHELSGPSTQVVPPDKRCCHNWSLVTNSSPLMKHMRSCAKDINTGNLIDKLMQQSYQLSRAWH